MYASVRKLAIISFILGVLSTIAAVLLLEDRLIPACETLIATFKRLEAPVAE